MDTRTYPEARKDPVNRYAQNIINNYHAQLQTTLPPELPEPTTRPFVFDAEKYLHFTEPILPVDRTSVHKDVAIIGGGIGGLYAALLLQEQGIPYTIYEASDRIGGRLYTYKDFPSAQSRYDYIDMGAMRFPKTPIMAPVFELFERLKLRKLKYYFDDREGNSTLFYNNVLRQRHGGNLVPEDWKIMGIPPRWGARGVHANVSNVVEPFKRRLIEDADSEKDSANTSGNSSGAPALGWGLMMEYDVYSTKGYMSGRRSDWRPDLDELKLMPYPLKVVEWCDTFHGSTSSFDRALTETVLDSLAFEYDNEPFEWYCIDGGSSQIAEKLDEYLRDENPSHDLQRGRRVVGIDADKNGRYVSLRTEDGKEARYGHIITTTTLPCLRMMSLSEAGLDYPQWNALRSLAYAPSTKVGVKFRTAWWQDIEFMQTYGRFGEIVGGQSFSDVMSRRVVYPSYGVDSDTPSTVLMVSYTVGSDALPWTGLVGQDREEALKRKVIDDLVGIHGFDDRGRKQLQEQWEDAAVHSWTTDQNTLGAFATFYPGQFASLWTHLSRPAAHGRLHFAGEAVSARHAWVVGALEASSRAVNTIIETSYPELRHKYEVEDGHGHPECWTRESLMKQVAVSLEGLYPGRYPVDAASE
ncbi:FAD-dependent oxidoreductase [Phanerochaete sordida]|uniref:FAD-dependent oxidoreductase n=1 Tax=Phanerochaete sordida TaxID=48140 RepID=A0A9P3GG02_9APHY|nr:FAD-dependent oxidoreductase [Phanerochaete sordida]